MASSVVLCAYLAVGLPIRFTFAPQLEQKAGDKAVYSTEVLSLLDLGLAHLRGRSEKTYSAPLATRSYAKEQVELPDGRQMRDFPRLRFGGAHLKDEADRDADVAKRALAGIGSVRLLLSLLVVLCNEKAEKRKFLTFPGTQQARRCASCCCWRGPRSPCAPCYHVLGTDKVGQDVFYLALKSIRTSLVIGTLTTLVLLPVGIALGIMAGYFRGWVDDVIQYFYTTLNSIPGVLLIAASVLMLQVVLDRHADWFSLAAQRADFRLLVLCAILGLTSWTGLARLLRGETLKLSELEYIQAARAFGVRDARILARHILPNVSHIVIIAMVMDFSGLVLAEAVLSYVGVGVDPSTNSFGTMINAARLEMSREPIVWWALATAFTFMLALVLAANLFADAVRDGFDPQGAHVSEAPYWKFRI